MHHKLLQIRENAVQRPSGAKLVKMAVMTDERYASCPVWCALVPHFAQELVAYARGESPLLRIFPHLETIWFKADAEQSDEALLRQLRSLQENNPDIDIVLCLDAGDPERMEAFFSLGLSDIIFIEEMQASPRSAKRSLCRMRQKRRDDADMRRERLELKQALEQKSGSIAWLCHEIRTPLNGMLGMMELLPFAGTENEREELLGIMARSGQSMLGLVSDVLDLSQLEASKMPIKAKSFPLRRQIDDCVSLYRLQAEQRGIQLQAQIAPEVPLYLLGDERKLGQILNNLVSNAIKYTDKGSVKISVRLENQDPSILTLGFSVSDTGYGISRDQWKQVFTPYGRTDSQQLTRSPSSGLGMSLTKQLVELLGGSIDLKSELGKGSTFHVSLPFALGTAPGTDSIKEMRVANRISQALAPERHVLVVDDDPINLKVAKRQLSHLAAHVTVASSGVEALEIIERQRFDLILVDCQMPHMDGSELLHILRKMPHEIQTTPIVALTALAQDRLHLLAQGFDDFLAKPACLGDIELLVAKWLPMPSLAGRHKDST